MQKTGIEYLTHTWNPLAMRCTPVSEGCEHCWHLRMADRLANNPAIDRDRRLAYVGEEPPVVNEDELEAPLHLRKPARIGVQFMGDLGHESAPWTKLYPMLFDIIEQCPQHTFLILTKRPGILLERLCGERAECAYGFPWHCRESDGSPLPNLWLGVTIENQARANERIPILLQIPAAIRFVSIEPMLGPVNMKPSFYHMDEPGRAKPLRISPKLDWVIIGGETGPGARPAKPEWFLSVIEQCKAAGVPVFVKNSPPNVPIIREFPNDK